MSAVRIRSRPRAAGDWPDCTQHLACCFRPISHAYNVDFALAAALLGAGPLVAGIGFLDDRGSLPAGVRLGVHIIAAVLGGLRARRVASGSRRGPACIARSLGEFGYRHCYCVDLESVQFHGWNRRNRCVGGRFSSHAQEAFLPLFSTMISAVAYSALVIAAASLAFLCWNWPPAKVFMGDVGSGYLGYVIAVVGLAGSTYFIGGCDDLADSWRDFLCRCDTHPRQPPGEREPCIYLAHRDHLYQRLAARRQGHRSVTLLVCSINILVLLPLAVWSSIHEDLAAPLAATTILCLSGLMIWVRAFVVAKHSVESRPQG